MEKKAKLYTNEKCNNEEYVAVHSGFSSSAFLSREFI